MQNTNTMIIVVCILLFLCLIFAFEIKGNIYLLDKTATIYVYLYGIRIAKISLVIIRDKIVVSLGRFGCLYPKFNSRKKHFFKASDLLSVKCIDINTYLGIDSVYIYNVAFVLNQLSKMFFRITGQNAKFTCYPISFREECTVCIYLKFNVSIVSIITSIIRGLYRKIKYKEKPNYDNYSKQPN